MNCAISTSVIVAIAAFSGNALASKPLDVDWSGIKVHTKWVQDVDGLNKDKLCGNGFYAVTAETRAHDWLIEQGLVKNFGSADFLCVDFKQSGPNYRMVARDYCGQCPPGDIEFVRGVKLSGWKSCPGSQARHICARPVPVTMQPQAWETRGPSIAGLGRGECPLSVFFGGDEARDRLFEVPPGERLKFPGTQADFETRVVSTSGNNPCQRFNNEVVTSWVTVADKTGLKLYMVNNCGSTSGGQEQDYVIGSRGQAAFMYTKSGRDSDGNLPHYGGTDCPSSVPPNYGMREGDVLKVVHTTIAGHYVLNDKGDPVQIAGRVAGSGMVEVVGGQIVKIDNSSGHIKPTKSMLIQSVMYLLSKGAVVRRVIAIH